ncbi:MAG: D-tyrosyl-tRNA(Tyr) deacylase [Bdellovibrionales bacterium]|nr:D-tyrosyl-tRNA(Tyr) deacylase [Bdellovibrionales bacterium]
MRAIIQRVREAAVDVQDAGQSKRVGQIGSGILTLLGVEAGDTEKDLEWVLQKISKLRIFEDAEGKMNLSALDLKKEHLLVSQFTLLGDTSQGNRPGFSKAARPEVAKPLFEKAVARSRELGLKTESGQFQAEMWVSLVNDGPVTFIIESPKT